MMYPILTIVSYAASIFLMYHIGKQRKSGEVLRWCKNHLKELDIPKPPTKTPETDEEKEQMFMLVQKSERARGSMDTMTSLLKIL